MQNKPICKLTGTQAVVSTTILEVSKALRQAGQEENLKRFLAEVVYANNYDHIFEIAQKYVEPI